jgi:hypothetical protein
MSAKFSVVSILASFCVWTKSLKCKDAINRDSTFQSLQVRRNSSFLSAVQTIEPSRPDTYYSDPSVRMTCHTFQMQTVQHHPSGRSVNPFWTSY